MQATISLIAIGLFCLLPVFIFGSNALSLFLGFLLGNALVIYSGVDLFNIMSSILPGAGETGKTVLYTFLLFILPLISHVLTKKKVKTSKRWLHVLLTLLIIPVIWLWTIDVQTPGVRGQVVQGEPYASIVLYRGLLILASAAWCGILLYSERHKEDGKHKKH